LLMLLKTRVAQTLQFWPITGKLDSIPAAAGVWIWFWAGVDRESGLVQAARWQSCQIGTLWKKSSSPFMKKPIGDDLYYCTDVTIMTTKEEHGARSHLRRHRGGCPPARGSVLENQARSSGGAYP